MEKPKDSENPVESASAGPDNSHCLLCHSRVGVSSRTCVEIFTKNLASEDRPVAYTIGTVLGNEVDTQSFHSHVICKKCYKLLYELDEIESRIGEIKGEILSSYKHTLQVRIEEKNAPPEADNSSGDKLTLITEDNNSVKYKIVTTKGRKKTLPKKSLPVKDCKGSGQQKENVDCGPDNDDADSDSDYVLELPGVEDGHELTVEQDGDQIVLKIKMEPDDNDDDDSIIIKKKRKMLAKEEEVELPEKLISKDDADFACCVCPEENRVTMDMKGVIAHLKAEHQIRVYICDICCQVFKKRNELSEHLDEHVATEEGDFQCETCNRIFTNLRLFRVHKRMHYPQNKMWTCEACGKRYSSRNLLEEHMNTHTGSRPYMCTTCGKDFASKYTFKAHSKTHEVRPRPFACDECNKSFLSVQNLQQHQRTHNGMRNFVCEQCGKAFGTARNLEVHTVVHSGYKPYICRVCGKAFARKAEIRDHERTHTGEKPYQCEFCGATFSQRSNLQSHKRATHYQDKRYKCGVCSKGFKRRRLLDYHMKAVHTGERPFKCNVCDATFVYPEHFKKHRRIHTGEKPFHCEVCGKAFNSRDNRNAHRFVHSDKKPYECLVCGAGFMRKPLLYNHMQSQGHLNDTIVVNQPRLTTDDDLMMEASVADLEGEEDEEDHVLEMIDEGAEDVDHDTKLYISELKEREVMQGTDEGRYITGEPLESEGDETEAVEHLIIDGQVHFAHPDDIVTIHGDVESEEVDDDGRTRMVVVPATPRTLSDSEECYEEQVVEMHEAEDGTSQQEIVHVEGEGGSVQLIQIQLQESDGSTGKRWYNIVNQ